MPQLHPAKSHFPPWPACLLLLFLLCLLLPTSSPAKTTLTIGLLPEMNVFKQMQRHEPLVAYIEKKLQIEVKLVMLSRYGNILENLQEKHIDAAFLGSFTGALAISRLGVLPVVRPLFLDGTSTYYGKIFVQTGSGITSPATMRGKRMVFVERATTAGYIFPLAYLRQNGILDYEHFFASTFFAGSHDAAISAVLDGMADIGAAKNTVFDRFLQQHPEAADKLTVLQNSPQVPSNGLCFKKEFDPALRTRIGNLLLFLHEDPEGEAVLEQFGALQFIETTANDYQPVIDMVKAAGLDLNSYQYRNQ